MTRRGLYHAALGAILLLASLMFQPGARAADPDPWLGRDKALHFSFSVGIAGVGYGATACLTDAPVWRLLGGAGLAIFAGVGKETYDHYGGGDASGRDLTWDLIGTATGIGVAWAIDRLLFH